ncbi:MFS transporter [uncultured Endozoicomonas sp.]|uniref:MFS transporter n=1 Tax=uncultured Endozoicomonas sp. TaxID=432652 RepID=UPI0026241CD3|nr:MFS transporter [uncultured Endozoicomonas sp.]
MSFVELKAAISLTLVFVFRMLGLFMVLPVLALFTEDLQGASPATVGLAIGAYGFSQALLQIPFGWMSDRWGRKPVILMGLFIFLVGSLVAAEATSMTDIIIGRILQGCGAISGAVTALMADLTREQNRTKAMAMIGMGIGVAFGIAMVVGPMVSNAWGLSGLFISNGMMSVVAMLIVLFVVPTPVVKRRDLNSSVDCSGLRQVFTDRQLLRHVSGIFTLHFVLMALFVFIPGLLSHDYAQSTHGSIYLAVIGGSFVLMVPMIIFSEKQRRIKQCYSLSIVMLFMAFALISQGELNSIWLLVGLFLFFFGFNFLEATLPSLVSKISPAGTRGTVMGVYSTSQFLGAALGGSVGGLSLEAGGLIGALVVCTIPTALWWWLSVTMKQPPYVSTMVVALHSELDEMSTVSERLACIAGVQEVTVLPAEKTAYLKVDKQLLDLSSLREFGHC